MFEQWEGVWIFFFSNIYCVFCEVLGKKNTLVFFFSGQEVVNTLGRSSIYIDKVTYIVDEN